MPPVFQPFDETRRSRGALQPPPLQTDKPRLNPGDVCVGCIVWLPPKDPTRSSIHCIKDGCCGKQELDDGGHNHPVVILKIRQKMGSAVAGDLVCTVACVTTFSDSPLARYMSKRRHYKEASIPIYDPDEPPLTTARGTSLVQLKLEEGRLKKQSYVRLQHTYRVPIATLRQYAYRNCRAYKRRLSNDSYNTLMGLLNLAPKKYELTKTLFETKDARLLALARSELPTVVRTNPVVSHPVTFAPQTSPYHYGTYGTTHVIPSNAQYVPLRHSIPARYHTQPSSRPEEAGGGGWSSFFKIVAGGLIVGLAWWYFCSTPVVHE